MASKLQICNLALVRISDGTITSLDEDSDQSNMCNLHFDQALESMLETYTWSDGIKRTKLALNDEEPLFGYPYSYKLPIDFIRLVQGYDATGVYNQQYRWNIEGRNVLSNIPEMCIKYVGLIEDVSILSPLATDALVNKLATSFVMSRAESKALYATLLEEYETIILPRAKSIDFIQNRDVSEMEQGIWVNDRSGMPHKLSN